MLTSNYKIETMSRPEVDFALELAAAEGWNPGLYDADAFYATDPGGFLVGKLKGEPIGTISAIKYGENFGFVGFYIVKPEFRGQGYGYPLWQAAMQRLQERNIGLDGVVEQQVNYRRSGFKLAYRNIRQQGITGGNIPYDKGLVELQNLRFSDIQAYDSKFFPAQRYSFLKKWLQQPQSKAYAYLKNNLLAGYGLVRTCREGYKIGPLFAEDKSIAEHIFLALRASVTPDEPLYLDTPEVNEPALQLAEKYKMRVSFETARMYTGKFPKIPTNKIFGVTTFELG
jgi:GNAT superfamily N-acetyltransferase